MRNFILFSIVALGFLFGAAPAKANEFVCDEFGNVVLVRRAFVPVYGGYTVATTNRVFVSGGYGANVVAVNRGFRNNVNVVAVNSGRFGSNVVAVNGGRSFGGGVNVVSINERRGIFGGLRSRSVNIVQAR